MRMPRLSLPVSRSALEAAKQETEKVRTELKAEVARLEGLLDVADDPDANLSGNQRQGLFRNAGGSQRAEDRDLNETLRRKVLAMAHIAYALKGQAENLIETHLDWILGDEITIKAKNDELQEHLEDLWQDEHNNLDEEHEELARALIHEGELVLEATLSQIDGHLELGWSDPLAVNEVVQDRRGRDAFLIVNGSNPGERFVWFLLNNLNDRIRIEPWPADLQNKDRYRYMIVETAISSLGIDLVVGRRGAHSLGFFFPWNRVKGGKRGRGELTSILDLIDAHDELVWSTVDVQNVKRMLILHVKDKSIRSKAQGREVLKKYGLLKPPENPKSVATNKEVEIEFVKHPGEESEKWLAEELGINIQGAKGFPEHWRGRSDLAQAGARNSDTLPLRRLRRKQRKLLRVFKKILDVMLELQRRAGIDVPEGEYELMSLEVGGKDRQRGSEVLKAVAAAIVQVMSVDGAKPELANAIFLQAVRELGFEVDKELEGLPPQLADQAERISSQVMQILSQRGRKDGDGTQDEGDRDRADEAVNR